MKRKLQLLLSCLILLGTLSAQITITNAYFPQAGDTLRTAIDAMPSGIDLLDTGVENTWDFTSLAGITQELVIRPASDGDFVSEFPGADLLTGSANNLGEFYFNVTDNTYEAMGYVGPDPANFGINVTARIVPNSVERRAPMEFFDINSVDNDFQVAFSADLLPGGLLDTFFLSPDSVRIRVATERLDVVDSWGTLNIPGGSYQVLREKRTEIRDTHLDIYAGFGPLADWIDITALIGFDFLGKDTTTSYHYYSNEAKEPIAVVTIDNATEDPVSVQYKADAISTSAGYVDKGRADIFAYPNPAINEVRFDFINLPSDTYDLKIYNILGVEVLRRHYNITGRRTVKLDLSSMRKGTYLYSLVDSKGKPISTKRLVIIKP